MSENNQKPRITIDVVSDVMCPWCYIGKKRLEGAIAELGDVADIDVEWQPFQLDATLPKEGKDRKQYFIDKFGSLENHAQRYGPVKAAGEAEGIPFRLDDIEVSPNTLDAHRLILWAGRDFDADTQDKLVSVLMRYFFEEVKHIGKDEVLIDAAKEAGMDIDGLDEKLKSDDDKSVVQEQIATMQQMGVSGVPFFIINKKYALQGAQPKENIINVLQDIAKET